MAAKSATVSDATATVVDNGDGTVDMYIEGNEGSDTWTILLPDMSHEQFDCIADQLKEIARLMESDPEALGVEQNYTVT